MDGLIRAALSFILLGFVALLSVKWSRPVEHTTVSSPSSLPTPASPPSPASPLSLSVVVMVGVITVAVLVVTVLATTPTHAKKL
jgi:hypothetical protein